MEPKKALLRCADGAKIVVDTIHLYFDSCVHMLLFGKAKLYLPSEYTLIYEESLLPPSFSNWGKKE